MFEISQIWTIKSRNEILSLLIFCILLLIASFFGSFLLALGLCIAIFLGIIIKKAEVIFLIWLTFSPILISDSFSLFKLGKHPLLTFDRIIIGGLFLFILIQSILKIKPLLPVNKFEVLFIILLIIILISVISKSENKLQGARVLTDGFLYPFFIYLIAKNLIKDDKYFYNFVNAFLFISVYLSSMGIFEYFTKIDLLPTKVGLPIRSGWLRANGPYINDVAFAINLSICFFIVLYKFRVEHIKNKRSMSKIILYGSILCLIFFAIILTFLRAVWLQTMIALLLWGFLRKKRKIILILILSLILLIIMPLISNIISSYVFQERIANIGTIESRFMIYDYALFLFKKNPFFGIGFENFYYITKHKNFPPYTHNTYLSFLTETGIIGFLVIMIIIFLILQLAYKYYKKSEHMLDKNFSIAFICVFVCFLMPWLSQESGYFHEINKLFFPILGVVVSRYRRLHLKNTIIG